MALVTGKIKIWVKKKKGEPNFFFYEKIVFPIFVWVMFKGVNNFDKQNIRAERAYQRISPIWWTNFSSIQKRKMIWSCIVSESWNQNKITWRQNSDTAIMYIRIKLTTMTQHFPSTFPMIFCYRKLGSQRRTVTYQVHILNLSASGIFSAYSWQRV